MRHSNLPSRVSYKACILILSIVFSLSNGLSAAQSLHDVKAGDYLFDGYVSRIEKKEPPCSAARAVEAGATAIRVTRGKNGPRLSVENFHEGITDFSIGKDGEIVKGLFAPPKTLRLDADGSLLLTLEKGPLRRFVYVKNKEAFVANRILAGDYMDSAGKRYSFGKDGRASWGAAKFPYKMELDCVGQGDIHGWFVNPKTNEGYIFGSEGGSLSIYRYDVEKDESESRPFITARKVGP